MKEVVYLQWIDAQAHSEWSEFSEFDIQKNIHAIGFVVREDEEQISLAATYGDTEANAVISIPKAWVTHRKTVRIDL